MNEYITVCCEVDRLACAGEPDYDPVFYYYHSDHLGSSEIMTDRDGDLVQHYGYYPFGDERYENNSQAFAVSNRYTSQILDEDTGLYYYGARYYDAELGRFIQADPIVPGTQNSQAFNRYSYVSNNPLKFIDPSGNSPILGSPMGAIYASLFNTSSAQFAALSASLAAQNSGPNVCTPAAAPVPPGAGAASSNATGTNNYGFSSTTIYDDPLYSAFFGGSKPDFSGADWDPEAAGGSLVQRLYDAGREGLGNYASKTIGRALPAISWISLGKYTIDVYKSQEKSSDHPILQTSFIDLQKMVGVIDIREAWIGEDLLTGETLPLHERWWRGVNGAEQMLTVGIGLFFGIRGGVRSLGSRNKGLTTPNKYFSNKTATQARSALTNKYGKPYKTLSGKTIWFNKRTGRSIVIHDSPDHSPHVDITTRWPKIHRDPIPLRQE